MGRLPAHSDHRWYQNEAELAQKTMALRQSLNGEWPFAHSPNPAARPADFWKEEADRSAFGRIQVPGHVELQGYGQIQYINTMYPWDGRSDLRPPQIDWNDAPVSSYVRRFDLDPARSGPGSGGQAGLHLSGRGGAGVLSVAERPVHRLQ